MIKKDDVWVVFPAFNEATVIQSVIERTISSGFSNIVVIDDGSQDDTTEKAKEAGAYTISYCLNRGVGAVFQGALMYAKRNKLQHIVFIDADGQHFPEDIDKLMTKMEHSGADIVIGSRFISNQKDVPYKRRLYNRVANMITFLGRARVTDSQSGFRLLNQKAIEKISLELDNYAACTEMIWKAKKNRLHIEEAPIRVVYTEYSMSKGQNFWKGIQTGYSLVRKLIN